jgi:LuxR family transcriptional regulator, quorum-sensing system regulator SdiA
MKRLRPYLSMTSVEELWAHHGEVMAGYGFDRLFYAFNAFRGAGLYDNPEDALLLTNMPADYIDAYVDGGMFRDGVMMRWAIRNTGAASWERVYAEMADQPLTDGERALRALNERHGILAGYTISFPMAIKNANAGIGMAVRRDMSQADADAVWAEHGAEIEILNHVAHLCILQLPATGQRRLLTPRQAEVLELVADGKTMQDIALILGRNVATVEKHLRGARDALGVETTAQAVRKASILNQIFRLDNRAIPAPGSPVGMAGSVARAG